MGIGKRIKDRRLEMNLSRAQLAKKVRVTPSAIANYENEISYPKPDIMISLIQYMEIDANYLYQDYLPPRICSNLTIQKEYGKELSQDEKEAVQKYRCLGKEEKRLIQILINQEYEGMLAKGNTSLPCRLPGLRKLHIGFILQDQWAQVQVQKKFVPEGTDFCFQIQVDGYQPIYKKFDLLALKNAPAKHNEIGLFCVNGICYIRNLCITDDSVCLRSLNVIEPDITISGSDCWECLGTVLDKIYGEYSIS